MFTFANPWLFWALPVLALPWLFRRRQEDRIQRIEFPLLRFLQEAEEKDLISPQLQEWLLLLLRTLLLLLILLALAGPRWQSQGGGSPLLGWLPLGSAFQRPIAAIDASYSMGYQDEGDSRLARARAVWERIDSSWSGVALRSYFWDERLADGLAAPVSRAEAEAFFDGQPTGEGASAIALFKTLTPELSEGDRPIVITDGQRLPWQDLLNGAAPRSAVPPGIVVTTGRPGARNLWCEVEALSSPPWGVSGWETLAGSVGAVGVIDPIDGILTIADPATGDEVYQSDYRFSQLSEGPSRIPFSFTIEAARLRSFSGDSVEWSLELDIEDGLPYDNSMRLTIPAVFDFHAALAAPSGGDASLGVIEASLKPGNDDSNQRVVERLSSFADLNPDIDLIVTSPSWAVSLQPPDQAALDEFVRQGGTLLLFTGGEEPGNDWSTWLEELGWTWLDAENVGVTGESVTVSPMNEAGEALSLWPRAAWADWAPRQHGSLRNDAAVPLVRYAAAGRQADLAVRLPLGPGSIWVVNTSLRPEDSSLLSPLFPAFLWELSKTAVKDRIEQEWTPPSPRHESNLTMLSEAEREQLEAEYGLQFATPETLDDALARLTGGADLRMLLLALCIAVALMESWLANRLASL